MRETASDIVAFSDANAPGLPMRSGTSSRASPIPTSRTSAAGCGSRTRRGRTARASTGATQWLRQAGVAPRLDHGRNGWIYALNRGDYVAVDPRWGHDLAFPYRMVQAGRRAVYEPAALAFEKPTPNNEAEYAREVPMSSTAGRSPCGARC